MLGYIDNYQRVWGLVDVGTVTLSTTDNELVITVFNHVYTLTLSTKDYDWNDAHRKHKLVDEINGQLFNLGANVKCFIGGVRGDTIYNCLVFQSTDGTSIMDVSGSFADKYFV